jgi:predicted Zn-dependent peptidase
MPFGPKWTQQFLAKYGDIVSTKWSTSLDSVCAAAVNPTKVKAWFNLLKEVLDTYHFRPENIYNFDESGFPIGKGSKRHVIA